LQHTPSAQTPLEQSALVSHVVPFAAAEPHVPRLHCAGGAQSLDVAHVVPHVPFEHVYGAQLFDDAPQVPVALQVGVETKTPEHAGCPHTVPGGLTVWQEPVPLQRPLPWHASGLEGAGQNEYGSVLAMTGAQTPLPGVPPSANGCWRIAAHDSHPGQLDDPQHTPLSQ
jgi:hypothetical protein